MRVVCLLPARNAADHLPSWFESIGNFADVVVALDDASTDATGDQLSAHPLVEVLLRNPPRPDYVEWNDSLNRNQLLDAARALEPDWIVSVDADERIPEEDGRALRAFIEGDAVPGIAYGFPRFRMIDDIDHYDVVEDRAYRLFAYRPGQVFPPDRLHFTAVPTSIPPHRWLCTNLRIQHLCALTAEHRRARRQKYREADPEQRWERDYSYIDAPPQAVSRFVGRRPNAPVILETRFEFTDPEPDGDFDWPVLSVLVVVDEALLDELIAVIDAVNAQAVPHPVEIIALARGPEVADDVARLRPGTAVVRIDPRASPGTARNVGLRVARGDYVMCFDAPARLEPGALDAVVDRHDAGHAYVSGRVENLTPSEPGWAAFFDDPGCGSFTRTALLRIGGFDEQLVTGIDAVARDRLRAAGQRRAECSLITFGVRTEFATANEYLRSRYEQGPVVADPNGRREESVGFADALDPDARAAYDRVRALRRLGDAAARSGAAYARLRRSRT